MLIPGKRSVFLLFILFGGSLGSCVNLKHVREFAETAIEGIGYYEKLPQSFTQICKENCEQKHIQNLNIHEVSCNCELNQKADSITTIIYSTTLRYFEALQEISNNDLTDYQTNTFTEALATGDFGPLKLEEADVKAYSKVSTLLLRSITDGYRRNKIKQYIQEAHEPLLALLHFLELNLNGNLRGKLEVQNSVAKNFYFDHVADKKLSVYERTKFAEDYFRYIGEIETHQKELATYTEVLKEIVKGHSILYAESNELKEVKAQKKIALSTKRLKKAVYSLHNTK